MSCKSSVIWSVNLFNRTHTSRRIRKYELVELNRKSVVDLIKLIFFMIIRTRWFYRNSTRIALLIWTLSILQNHCWIRNYRIQFDKREISIEVEILIANLTNISASRTKKVDIVIELERRECAYRNERCAYLNERCAYRNEKCAYW